MLSTVGWSPAMYLRIWFEHQDRGHQRAYTVTDPDLDTDSFTLAVAVHEGPAVRWLAAARPGDTRQVTLLGRGFQQASHDHERYLALADTTSIAALGDVLGALDDRPADILVELQHDEDHRIELPRRPQDTLTVLRRREADAPSSAVLEALAARDLSSCALWSGLDTRTSRAVAQHARAAGVHRQAIDAIGYWDPRGMSAPDVSPTSGGTRA